MDNPQNKTWVLFFLARCWKPSGEGSYFWEVFFFRWVSKNTQKASLGASRCALARINRYFPEMPNYHEFQHLVCLKLALFKTPSALHRRGGTDFGRGAYFLVLCSVGQRLSFFGGLCLRLPPPPSAGSKHGTAGNRAALVDPKNGSGHDTSSLRDQLFA